MDGKNCKTTLVVRSKIIFCTPALKKSFDNSAEVTLDKLVSHLKLDKKLCMASLKAV